ncbi:ABC transporter ATP-binding protein [bacterium]|nr:ABC transporter ATP-binding protein [bacterium]
MADGKGRAVVELRGVTRRFRSGGGFITPLENVDLTINEGEFVVLMGPSGTGKSTMLNLVAGIDKPDSGRIIVAGEDITGYSEDALARWRTRAIGYIFQQFNLLGVLTARENVELPLSLLPIPPAKRRELVDTALEVTGITDRAGHYPRQLSGGQEQRVAIARAIACDPLLLLGDEPTGALDTKTAKMVMELLAELNRRFHKTILLVTHDPAVAAYGQRVLHLNDGQIEEEVREAAAHADA